MTGYKGSKWSKWDLHVHTPDSIVSEYNGDWDRFIDDIEALPHEFKVIGINDYIFIDGYKRVLEEKRKGRFKNIDLFLPVIELRVDKFGGSKSNLSKINYHIIFSDELSPEVIEAQFLNALATAYQVSPQYEDIAGSGKWHATPTRESLIELGSMIINSVPPEQRVHFGSSLKEGFNNFCVNFNTLSNILSRHYFNGKFITAVGKTEWSDIKWNDQSIADKKNIINLTDVVFMSSKSVEDYEKARQSLKSSKVNANLLDCSDAHRFSDSTDKDRIGKCFTWVKADSSFEGLRQAIYEFDNRIKISENEPIHPPLKLDSISINIPEGTLISSDTYEDVFCFSGEHHFEFSPYLTCIIGGRGSGKSTLINLLHETFKPGKNEFFSLNRIKLESGQISDHVKLSASVTADQIEFLGQNSIEEFASNSKRFSEAIFSRLLKLEKGEAIANVKRKIERNVSSLLGVKGDVLKLYDEKDKLIKKRAELSACEKIVSSYQSERYKQLTEMISDVSKKTQENKKWISLSTDLNEGLKLLIQKSKATNLEFEKGNLFAKKYVSALKKLEEVYVFTGNQDGLEGASVEHENLLLKLDKLRGDLDEYLKSRGLSKENLSDVSNVQSLITSLNQEIPDSEAYISMLEGKIEDVEIKRDIVFEYGNLVSDALNDINSRLEGVSDEVKTINLTFSWDREKMFEDVVDSICRLINSKVDKANLRANNVKGVLDGFDFTKIGSHNQLLDKLQGNGITARLLREFFESESNFQQLLIDVEIMFFDIEKYGKVNVFYDSKPIQNTSFGQRCTAAIVALIMLGNTPIIIDEPEAHLDSNLIAKYLVELVKFVKVNRQIIFATHNANFVINGDAELVHVLTMTDVKRTTSRATSIENLSYREQLLSLEGGHEAFKKRERKYFRRVP